MPERSRGRHAEVAAVFVRVALVAVVLLLAAGCGDEAGDDAASQTPTATETVAEATTEIGADEGDATRASPPPPASPGPVIRFAGSGDRVLPPVRVLRGGATFAWRNGDEVFTLFSQVGPQGGIMIDTVEPRGEASASIPAGRYVFSVVASGDWSLEIRNARRAR
ncbi:MAG TPA: hypothetical protein VG079_03010 [Gaiellaceae bacterium]|nr:hypothetical protein [Gaiellaceae bacterium]